MILTHPIVHQTPYRIFEVLPLRSRGSYDGLSLWLIA